MSARPDLHLYYGVEPPPLSWSTLVRGWVVLQAYHPVVSSGVYEHYFPRARRFAYWNPTRMALAEWRASRQPPSILGIDARWNTVLLDLEDPACRSQSVARALSLLELEGVDGLFVDDLDTWAEPSRRATLRRAFDELATRRARPCGFAVNRGFPFWHDLEGLEAVLLESISSQEILASNETDFAWYRSMLSTHLRLLRSRRAGVRVYGSRYRGDPTPRPEGNSAPERSAFVQEFLTMIDATLELAPQLSTWPYDILSEPRLQARR